MNLLQKISLGKRKSFGYKLKRAGWILSILNELSSREKNFKFYTSRREILIPNSKTSIQLLIKSIDKSTVATSFTKLRKKKLTALRRELLDLIR